MSKCPQDDDDGGGGNNDDDYDYLDPFKRNNVASEMQDIGRVSSKKETFFGYLFP